MNNLAKTIITALCVLCLLLGWFLKATYNKLERVSSDLALAKTESSGLTDKLSSNDRIASETIASLNDSLVQCQKHQDELASYCEKRIQLLLESKETPVHTSKDDHISNDTITGVDKGTSNKYIEELNKLIYDFNQKD